MMAFVRWSGVRPLLPALRRHLRRGSSRPADHDDVHEQHGGPSARRAGGRRCRRPGLVRHDDDAPSREGVAVPPAPWCDDGVHRLVEPHPQRAGDRARVERPRVSGLRNPDVVSQDGRGLRVVLGERRLRPVRPDGVRRADRSSPTSGTERSSCRRPRSTCVRSRSGCSSRSRSPVATAGTATCSSRRRAPARP